MTDMREVIETDAIIHPGEYLAEELEVRGVSQRALATALGRSPQAVNEIVRGKRPINAETALDLESVFETPAYVWMRLQDNYELALARRQRQARAAGDS